MLNKKVRLKRLKTHVSFGWQKKYARIKLESTMDYAYKNHDEVLCNGCFEDMRPNNCYMVEYSNNKIDWKIYDVYCFDCTEQWFSKAEVVDNDNT